MPISFSPATVGNVINHTESKGLVAGLDEGPLTPQIENPAVSGWNIKN
jgi:hypothetical protein